MVEKIFCWWTSRLLLIDILFHVAIANGADIIFSNDKDIRLFTYSMNPPIKYENIQGGIEECRRLAYDYQDQSVFYTDTLNHTRSIIRKVSLTTDRNDHIVVDAMQNANNGISVDWVTKKLYFTDAETNRVEVCNYNGTHRRVLVSKELDQPVDVAVLPQKGYMFVVDWGDMPKVERYNMDGSNGTILVKTDIKWPYSISVDMKTFLVYWTDMTQVVIEYMNIDGTNRRKIDLQKLSHSLFSVSVFNSTIYWTDGKSSIFSMHKDELLKVKKVDKLSSSSITPFGLSIFSKDLQPPVQTGCLVNNGGCSHLCLLIPTGYLCACPTGIALKEDKKTCEDGMKRFLLIARKVDIRVMSLDADVYVDVILPIKGIRRGFGIDYDILTKRVYWTDHITESINSAYMDGTGFQKVVSYDIKPDNIAIDWIARNLYWTDPELKRIEVSRMDGSSRGIIVSENLDQPRGIAVDPVDGRIYWSDWGNVSKIESANLDGSDRKIVVDQKIRWPNGIALDLQHRKLYWVDAKYKAVKSYELDTGKVEEIHTDERHPFAITSLGDHIYWTDWLRRVNSYNTQAAGGKPKVILHGPGVSDVMGIKAVNIDLKYGKNSPCHYTTNNCSHLCFYNPRKPQSLCACPTTMELGIDGKTCYRPSGFLLFSTMKSIMKISVDTFKNPHRLPLPEFDKIPSLDVYKNKSIYWVGEMDLQKSTINTAFLNGSGYQAIVTAGLNGVKGLSVDWMAGNIYWILTAGRIEVSRLDGKYRKVVVFGKDVISPQFLAVNPHISKMYWFQGNSTDVRHFFTLWEANLDGTARKSLVSDQYPQCITIDFETNIVYWVTQLSQDTVKSYNPATETYATALDSVPPYTKGLLIYNNKIFYGNQHDGSIQKVDLHPAKSSDPTEVIRGLRWILDIKPFHPDVQKENNTCSVDNGGCQQLCFASSPTMHSCGCSTTYSINPDGRTCRSPSHFMLLFSDLQLNRIVFNNLMPEAVLPITFDKPLKALDVDVVREYIYGLKPDEMSIIRTLQDGSNYTVIAIKQLQQDAESVIHDFSIDPFSNAMYWTDEKQNSINFLHLELFTNGTILHRDYQPRKIVVFPEISKIFWTSLSHSGVNIFSSSMAGTEIAHLHKLKQRSRVNQLTLDHSEKRLYWLDAGLKHIASVTVQGKNLKKYLTSMNKEPLSFGVFSNSIYWTDGSTKFIRRLYKHNDSRSALFHGKYESMGVLMTVNYTRKNENHPCSLNNGGCSHICYIDYEESLTPGKMEAKALCACPLNYQLDFTKKKCILAGNCFSDQMFCMKSSLCISDNKKCNYQCDCGGGCEDEANCDYHRDCSTSPDLVKCGIGCIHRSKICDNVVDCPDGEDEDDSRCTMCGSHQYVCGNICMLDTTLCDGITDCLNGEDEKNCPNGTSITIVRPATPSGRSKSRVVAGIISGAIVCFIVLMLVALLCFKIRNSKKNPASEQSAAHVWPLAQFNRKSPSITSDDPAKSSVSTYISAASDLSYYDRDNPTGASSMTTSDYSRIPLNPPPSPILSTITETNDPYAYATCENCRCTIEEVPMSEIGDAPPPTLATTALQEEVDLYLVMPQPQWKNRKTVCHSCSQSSRNRHRKTRRSNRRNDQAAYRSNGAIHSSELEPLERQFYDNNIDPGYNEDRLYIDCKQPRGPRFFDPPPTPCTTYLSDDERPPSPAETEQSMAFSVIRDGEPHPHFAPPPSPTSQL